MASKCLILLSICFIFTESIKERQNSKTTVVQGLAEVLNGHTLIIDNEELRLFGIEAPEIHQICNELNLGKMSKEFLEQLTRGKLVICKGRQRDKKRRLLVYCTADDTDINSVMVKSGYAFNFKWFTSQYDKEEKFAKDNLLPVWKNGCENPFFYRNRRITDL